jgi:hypothetical protein
MHSETGVMFKRHIHFYWKRGLLSNRRFGEPAHADFEKVITKGYLSNSIPINKALKRTHSSLLRVGMR